MGGNTGLEACGANITVNLIWNPNCGDRPLTRRAYLPGTSTLPGVFTGTLASSGIAAVSTTLTPGNYDVYIRINGSLSKAFFNTALSGLTTNSFTITALALGYVNLNDRINLTDVSQLSAAFATTTGQAGYNLLADLICDGTVNLVDLSILSGSFGLIGADPAAN